MLKACLQVPAKFGFKIQLVFNYRWGENIEFLFLLLVLQQKLKLGFTLNQLFKK